MRKTIIIAALLTCTFVTAQEAETIVSIIVNEHDAEWYAAQAEAWQKKVDDNPKDERAWRNLFYATNYYEMLSTGYGDEESSPTASVIRRMEEALPDSYVLNLCKGRYCLKTDSTAMRGDNIYRAIELMPKDACDEEVNFLACRLWSIDPDNPLVGELFTKSYQQKGYPSRIMHYNMNMLRSMQPQALYFANGDIVTAPMKMIQDALNERQDVTVIPLSFLHSEPYMKALYQRLNIAPPCIDVQDYGKYGEEWSSHYEADLIMYLIKQSMRPTYFSTDILQYTKLDKDSIYNEGILLKYSPRQYDNFTVAMHNVKEVYHLEYLAEPDLVYDSWMVGKHLSLNNVMLLSHLVLKLRKRGETEQADRLKNILGKCLEYCKIPEAPVAQTIFNKETEEKK